MTIREIYEKAKSDAIVGEPLVELTAACVLVDSQNRVFIELRRLVELIEAGSQK